MMEVRQHVSRDVAVVLLGMFTSLRPLRRLIWIGTEICRSWQGHFT